MMLNLVIRAQLASEILTQLKYQTEFDLLDWVR
jgi:hypothetical protein